MKKTLGNKGSGQEPEEERAHPRVDVEAARRSARRPRRQCFRFASVSSMIREAKPCLPCSSGSSAYSSSQVRIRRSHATTRHSPQVLFSLLPPCSSRGSGTRIARLTVAIACPLPPEGELVVVPTGAQNSGGGDDDKEVLVELKHFLQDNNKVNRGAYDAWQESDASPCEWHGVQCTSCSIYICKPL